MSFFQTSLLFSYNHLFNDLFFECKCYSRYRPREAFDQYICENRQSYMACLDYRPNAQSSGTSHLNVPVMLGSELDLAIRGEEEFEKSRPQWGLFILGGTYRLYSNYATFDPLSLHIRETREGVRYLGLYTYIGSNGIALKYSNKYVSYEYRGVTKTNNQWVSLLERSNARRTLVELATKQRPDLVRAMFGEPITVDDYRGMFDAMLAAPFHMNDLRNKRIVNPAQIARRFVDKRIGVPMVTGCCDDYDDDEAAATFDDDPDTDGYEPRPAKRRRVTYSRPMGRSFESGQIFLGLGKRAVAADAENRSARHTQTYDQPMHEGRSSKAAHLLATVRRDSNAAVRNSRNALAFPEDAINYLCLITAKDLKSAGEQNVLSDMVISTENTDDRFGVYEFLYTHQSTEHRPDQVLVAFEGTPTRMRFHWTLDLLVQLKMRFPFVTTCYYPGYVNVQTCGCVPIKYHPEHDAFFSPAESIHWKLSFPELDMFSTTAKEIPHGTLTRTPPAKLTVSINNIKGSVALLTSDLHQRLMHNALGVTAYVDLPPGYKKRLLNHAVIAGPGSADTTNFNFWFRQLDQYYRILKNASVAPRGTDLAKAMSKLRRIYSVKRLQAQSRRPLNRPYSREQHPLRKAEIDQYRKRITDVRKRPPSVWTMRLWAMFGNPHGHCVEDGAVIDTSTVNSMEVVHYNVCITTDFTFRTVRHPQEAKFVAVESDDVAARRLLIEYAPDKFTQPDVLNRMDALVGYMIVPQNVTVEYTKKSKHTEVKKYVVSTHMFHLLYFLPKLTDMYRNLRVRANCNNTALTVIITGQREVRVHIGSKVANAFGQKNIISEMMDLRSYQGVTRDGRIVHAQIVYSDVSILARVTAGQLWSMITSKDFAIAQDGTMIAPVDLILHSINPYSNHKQLTFRADTLTNIYGFDAQGLCVTSQALRKEDSYARLMRIFGLHGFKVRFQSFWDVTGESTAKPDNNPSALFPRSLVVAQQRDGNQCSTQIAKLADDNDDDDDIADSNCNTTIDDDDRTVDDNDSYDESSNQ